MDIIFNSKVLLYFGLLLLLLFLLLRALLSAQLRETTDRPTDQSDLLPTKIHTGGFSTLHGVLIRSAVPVPGHGHLRFDDDE